MVVFVAFLLAVGHGLLAGMFGVLCVSLYMTDCCRGTCFDKVRHPHAIGTAPSSHAGRRRFRRKRKARSQRRKTTGEKQNEVKQNEVKQNEVKQNEEKQQEHTKEKEKPRPPFSFRPQTSIFSWLLEMVLFSLTAFTVLFVGVSLLSFIGQLSVSLASDLLPQANENGMRYSEKYGVYQVEGEHQRHHSTHPGVALTAVYGLGMVGWVVFSFLLFAVVMWLGPYVMSWGS